MIFKQDGEPQAALELLLFLAESHVGETLIGMSARLGVRNAADIAGLGQQSQSPAREPHYPGK